MFEWGWVSFCDCNSKNENWNMYNSIEMSVPVLSMKALEKKTYTEIDRHLSFTGNFDEPK